MHPTSVKSSGYDGGKSCGFVKPEIVCCQQELETKLNRDEVRIGGAHVLTVSVPVPVVEVLNYFPERYSVDLFEETSPSPRLRELTLGIEHLLDRRADESCLPQDDELEAITRYESDVSARLRAVTSMHFGGSRCSPRASR